MTKPIYRGVWITRFERHRESFKEFAGWDPFNDWALNTAPDGTAEDYLREAVFILYGQGDRELSHQLLNRCLNVADRTVAENKLQSPRCVENAPENHGRLLRARTYARAMLGEPLDEPALLEASGAIEEACKGFPRRKWDDYQEARYLEAIRLVLLSGVAETSRRLLQRRRTFLSHVEEHELLNVLASALATGLPVRDEVFRIRFDAYFDEVRNPDYHPLEYSRVSILRLEIGLLRDKYLISPDGNIDWQRAIDAIAE